jgi:outer membrane protein insertion porin family
MIRNRLRGALASILFACAALGPVALSAQEPAPPPADGRAAREPVIERIDVIGAGDREAEVRAGLSQRIGAAFDRRGLRRDVQWLWRWRRIRVDVAELAPGPTAGSAALVLQVHAFQSFRRAVFVGNEAFERTELELRAGLFGQAIDVDGIAQVIRRVGDYYREEGFAHVDIGWTADETTGEVVFSIVEGPEVRIEEIEFDGADGIPGGGRFHPGLDLFGTVKHKPGFLLIGDGVYSEQRVQEDVVALLQVYADYGYHDAKVEYAVEFLGEERDEVRLTYLIEEGPLYRIREVRFVGESGEELRFGPEEFLANVRLAPGMPHEAARVQATVAEVTRMYAQIGHPSAARAEVEPQRLDQFFAVKGNGDTRRPGPRVVFHPDAAEVDLEFQIHEGMAKRVRDVVIRGLERTEDRVARRELSVEPGGLASEDETQRSARRLVGQGFFTDAERIPYVNWRWRDYGDDQLVDLWLDLKDQGSTGQFRIGGAWNTDAGPALILDMEKRNFDITDLPSSPGRAMSEILDGEAFTGAGQSLRLSLHPGTEYSTYSISFTEPDLLREHVDRLSFTATGSERVRLYSRYDEERTTGSFSLGRRFGRFFTIYAGPEIEGLTVNDLSPGAPANLLAQEGDTDLNTLNFGFRYDTVEDPFSPVDGGSVGMGFGETGRLLGGDEEYFTASLNAEKFFPLWRDDLGRHWVLALRGRARQGWASGDLTELPYTEQFYIGGQSSVRGFDFRGIGEDANGFARGGDASWDASLELRFPLLSTRQRGLVDEYEWVRGAFFLDAGAFGEDFGELDPTRAAVGVGVRMRLPMLPLVPFTLDFGWPLADEPGDDSRVISFTLGTF